LIAQEPEVKTHKHEFGAQAGFTTGVGFSYRHWFDRFGLQVAGIPIKTSDYFFGSIGVTGLYTLKNSKYIRAYLYLGNHYIYTYDEYETWDINSSSAGNTIKETNQQYNVGFGPGFSVGRIVEFNLMIGYGLYDITGELNMLPTGEIGLYFTF
jgi:hypothetical protein